MAISKLMCPYLDFALMSKYNVYKAYHISELTIGNTEQPMPRTTLKGISIVPLTKPNTPIRNISCNMPEMTTGME